MKEPLYRCDHCDNVDTLDGFDCTEDMSLFYCDDCGVKASISECGIEVRNALEVEHAGDPSDR